MNKENTNHNLKVKHYTMEKRLLELDAQIKSCLSLDQADTDKCLRAMDDILGLSIDSLALKKHSHIVETVKRVIRDIYRMLVFKINE